jgi:hypothetical protein
MHECQDGELADIADGRRKVAVEVDDQEIRHVPALRRIAADFPEDRRVNLLHLHGSLTYWEKRDGGIFAKLPKEMLDDDAQWRAVRERTTNVRPSVVLASPRDKAQHVTEYPYSLAYEMFARGLAHAPRWIVIGYSFRDEPVNRMLSTRFLDLEEKPSVLEATYGPDPTDREIERAFGWGADDGPSSGWLTVVRTGADGLQDSAEWETYLTD